MTARDDAAKAGADAAVILAAAERAILGAMASAASAAIRGTIPPALARRKVRIATAAALGAASSRLLTAYDRAVQDVTGETGPLPDAPGQVAAAILRAQHDADVAFGAVLAAAGAESSRMPPPSSPYRRIVTRAQRGTGPGLPAARAALAAITVRGLTGYVSPKGRRWPLAAYAQRAVRTATAQLARQPVMSAITARRGQLAAVHVKAVTAAWNEAAKSLDARDVVQAFQGDARVSGAGQQSPGLLKRWRQEAARAAVLSWFSILYRTAGWARLVAALEATVRDGMAEGEAGALALAAYRQRMDGFDTAAAFAVALRALQGDMGVTRAAQDAAQHLMDGMAADVARKLAAMAADGASEDELAEVVAALVAGDDIAAAGRWTEETLWEAYGSGAVALYRKAMGQFTGQGIEIDWLNDSSPCSACKENADGSPYTPYDVPAYPQHRSCRCWLTSDSRLPLSLLTPFLTAAA